MTISTIRADLRTAFRTPPTGLHWRDWLLVLAYGAFALAVGLSTGLLAFDSPTWFELLVLPPLLAVYPCVIEESIFRGLLLPAHCGKQLRLDGSSR